MQAKFIFIKKTKIHVSDFYTFLVELPREMKMFAWDLTLKVHPIECNTRLRVVYAVIRVYVSWLRKRWKTRVLNTFGCSLTQVEILFFQLKHWINRVSKNAKRINSKSSRSSSHASFNLPIEWGFPNKSSFVRVQENKSKHLSAFLSRCFMNHTLNNFCCITTIISRVLSFFKYKQNCDAWCFGSIYKQRIETKLEPHRFEVKRKHFLW